MAYGSVRRPPVQGRPGVVDHNRARQPGNARPACTAWGVQTGTVGVREYRSEDLLVSDDRVQVQDPGYDGSHSQEDSTTLHIGTVDAPEWLVTHTRKAAAAARGVDVPTLVRQSLYATTRPEPDDVDTSAWRLSDLTEVHRLLDDLNAPQYASAATRLAGLVSHWERDLAAARRGPTG